jgi:hypothetical protein
MPFETVSVYCVVIVGLAKGLVEVALSKPISGSHIKLSNDELLIGAPIFTATFPVQYVVSFPAL